MEPRMLVTDLGARRPQVYVTLALAGVAAVAVLDLLYWASLTWAASTRDGSVAAFDLDAEGTVASWFSSVLLFVAGQVTLVVWQFKRAESREWKVESLGQGEEESVGEACEGRPSGITEAVELEDSSLEGPDCSHGSGGGWSWLAVAGVWFVMSLDEAGSLHEGWKEWAARLWGTRIYGDGSILWAVPYFVVLSAVGWFIWREARSSRATIGLLATAGGCYALAAAAQMGLVLKDLGAREVMFEESAEMLGHLSIWLCMLTYARYLILERESWESIVIGPYPVTNSIDFAHRRGLAFRDD